MAVSLRNDRSFRIVRDIWAILANLTPPDQVGQVNKQILSGCFLLAAILLQPAIAQDKQAQYDELIAVGAQLQQLKGNGQDRSAQWESLLADYRDLAASLGGDDPAGFFQRDNATPAGETRVATPPPDGITATTFSVTSAPGAAIPDLGSVSADITVGGAGPYLLDLDLTTGITHTYPGDLEISLTSPAGTTVVITTDNGGGSNDVFAGTLWDDQAGQPATDFAYSDGIVASPLVPEQALSPFIGEDPNGTWTLDIIDDEGADVGTLNSWTLDVTTIPAAPDAIALIFTNDIATTIPDGPGSTVLSNLVVGGLGNHVCDITMTTDITHTFPGDLDITLTSPAGTTQVITTDNGGANDNVFSGTVWTDDGTPATDFAYANLTTASPLAPEGAFGGFHSEDPTGTWTLSITDDAGLDTGTLNDWSLTMATCSAALPEARPVPTFGPLGLIALMLVVAIAGLVVLRRHM